MCCLKCGVRVSLLSCCRNWNTGHWNWILIPVCWKRVKNNRKQLRSIKKITIRSYPTTGSTNRWITVYVFRKYYKDDQLTVQPFFKGRRFFPADIDVKFKGCFQRYL